MLEEVIEEYRLSRITDAQYLQKVKEIMESVQNRTGDKLPDDIRDKEVAKAFFGIIYDAFEKYDSEDFNTFNIAGQLALKIDDIILANRVVDWHRKKDVQNQMLSEIEDAFFSVKGRHGVDISLEEIDEIMDQCLKVALHRYE